MRLSGVMLSCRQMVGARRSVRQRGSQLPKEGHHDGAVLSRPSGVRRRQASVARRLILNADNLAGAPPPRSREFAGSQGSS